MIVVREVRLNAGVDWTEWLVGLSWLVCGGARVFSMHIGPVWVMVSWKARS